MSVVASRDAHIGVTKQFGNCEQIYAALGESRRVSVPDLTERNG